MNNALLVIAIMAIAGGLGGLANYLTTQLDDNESHPLLKRVTVGSIAAIVVPAFLTLISSSIIKEQMTATDYFVFAGFCLLAGFSSKAFLTSMSKGLLDRVKSVEERQLTLESEVDPILEKETEIDDDDTTELTGLNLNEVDEKVLDALANTNYTRRYLKGVVSETKHNEQDVFASLQKLKGMELVRQSTNNKSQLFWLTHKGRKTVRDLTS